METKKYRCLIVDDEPIARKIVYNYVLQIPNIECVEKCKNALEALEILSNDSTIDIIFLDINLPNLSGFSFAKIISKGVKIIFTTAYTEYAIDSYEINAVDYLLKPFTFERFTKAVFKAIDLIEINPSATIQTLVAEKKMFIKSEGKSIPIKINDILYCEANKNYTKINLKDNSSYLTLVALSKFEIELLNFDNDFMRIHRSFVINLKEIKAISTNHATVGNQIIPIGEQYKEIFFKKIGIVKSA